MGNSKELDIVAVGAITIDNIFLVHRLPRIHFCSLIHKAGVYFGGRAPNVAAMCAMLDLKSGIISVAGADFKESGYLGFLRAEGVDTEGIFISADHQMDQTYIFSDTTGAQLTFFLPDAFCLFGTQQPPEQLISKSKIVHISSGNPTFNSAAAKLGRMHEAIISFDVGNDVYMQSVDYLETMLGESDWVFFNEYEWAFLRARLGLNSLPDLLEYRLELIALLHKTHSVEALVYGQHIEIPPTKTRIVDPTGASDALVAGFLAAHMRQYPFKEALEIGTRLTSYVVQKPGCLTNIPTWEQLVNSHNRSSRHDEL